MTARLNSDSTPGEHIRLLIIENNTGDRKSIEKLLSETGGFSFSPVYADTLSDALERLSREVVDLVLVDLFLHDSQGVDTVARIHELSPDTPIIVLTSLHDLAEEMAGEALKAGAQDYLISGLFDGPMLLRSIRYTISRSLAERETRASNRRLRQLIEVNTDGMIVIDKEGLIRFANPAAGQLMQRTREDLLGAPFGSPVLTGKPVEIDIVQKGGRVILAEMRATDIEWERQPAYLASLRDITERRRLEEQLSRSQRMESLGLLAGGIAHDFNNILTGIIGYASLMNTKMTDGHPFQKYVQTIEKNAQRAAALTSQLLFFARQADINYQSAHLNDVAKKTVSMIKERFDQSIEIRLDLSDGLPVIQADAGQLGQAVMKLCLNAQEAMPDGGILTIGTSLENLTEDDLAGNPEAAPGSYLALAVHDTGVGIRPENEKKIFDPFFSTKNQAEGLGLGLSTVYGIVKNHKGFIRFSSKVGDGSVFRIYLPPEKDAPQKDSATVEEAVPPLENSLILIVDDENIIRQIAKDALEEFGFRVIEAESGQKALQIFRQHFMEIDLVILDMVMPGMGGQEVFLKMKDISPEVKIIVSSGYSDKHPLQDILKNGNCGFIGKPYSIKHLLTAVWNALGRPKDTP